MNNIFVPKVAVGGFVWDTAPLIISLEQQYAGHAKQAAIAGRSLGMYKYVIVVDDDIDPTNMAEVLWAISMRCQPLRDVQIIKRGRDTSLDPSIPAAERTGMIAITSRMIIDATLHMNGRSNLQK